MNCQGQEPGAGRHDARRAARWCMSVLRPGCRHIRPRRTHECNAGVLAGCGKTISAQQNFDGLHVWENATRTRRIAERAWQDERDEVGIQSVHARLSRMSRASCATVCGAGELFQHPVRDRVRKVDLVRLPIENLLQPGVMPSVRG
jgi:hypothetical protein